MEKGITLTAVFEPSKSGGYIAYIEEFEGINSQGETLEEAKENLIDAVNLVFQESREKYHTKNPAAKIIKSTLTISL